MKFSAGSGNYLKETFSRLMMVINNNKTGDGVHIWWWEGHLLLEEFVALQIYSVNSDPNITGPLTHRAIY